MSVAYRYDSDLRIVFVEPEKVVCLEDIQDYFRRILEDETIQTGFVEVVDFESIDEFRLTSTEAVIVSKLIQQVVDQKQERGVVLLARSDLQYGMARMISIIMEGIIPISIVRSEQEAQSEALKIHGQYQQAPKSSHQ